MALQLLPYGVLMADSSGRAVVANQAARVLLDLEEGREGEAQVCCEGQSLPLRHLLRDHAEGRVARRRLALEHAEHGWLQTTLTRLADDAGSPWVHALVERGSAPDWRLAGRSDPLSIFAHELRNALTSLREGLALVAEGAAGELTEAQQQLLKGVQEDADRMARLSDDMLAANRLGAGRVRVTARPVRAVELVRAAAQAFASAAAEREVDLGAEPGDEALVCHADRDLLIQALDNLVGNAAKYTPAGGRVRLGVRAAAAEDGEPIVEFWVRDTGPGLSREDVERIAHRGLGAARSREGSGLGIGLSVVREIAEQHGGHLLVESEPGRGSCFRLQVPTDFRRSHRWLLSQVADGLKLARAIGAPLAVAVVEARDGSGRPWTWTAARGLVHLPLIEQCVADCLRPSDSVVMNGSSATLVLHDVDSPGARRVAGRAVVEMTRLLATLPGWDGRCELALGVASYPAEAETAQQLLAQARADLRPLSDADEQTCPVAAASPDGAAAAGSIG
ncbi:MAG: ATP-binding protein [Planctomycetota bacterium]